MARIVAYMDVGKGREQDAEALPTTLLHFLCPWWSEEVESGQKQWSKARFLLLNHNSRS